MTVFVFYFRDHVTVVNYSRNVSTNLPCLPFLQLCESTTKDHMSKWTELEEKCAKMIAHTKELEKRFVYARRT